MIIISSIFLQNKITINFLNFFRTLNSRYRCEHYLNRMEPKHAKKDFYCKHFQWISTSGHIWCNVFFSIFVWHWITILLLFIKIYQDDHNSKKPTICFSFCRVSGHPGMASLECHNTPRTDIHVQWIHVYNKICTNIFLDFLKTV